MFTKRFIPQLFLIALIVAAATPLFAGGEREQAADELVIYAYDSFVSEWGPGPVVVPIFEEKTGIDVTLISAGDAGQVLSRAILEMDDPQADIILGIDNNLLARALDAEILSTYKPEGIDKVPDEFVFDPEYHVIPYDYGYFSIVYDSKVLTDPPSSLEDLTEPRFVDSLILMDPRTSSPGLGFLLWTIEVYGEDFPRYWRRLTDNILTITEGWDSGYGLFTSGEAPMVLSYSTSPAYHLEYEDTRRYRAIPFDEGNYLQIEGIGILEGAPNREAAEKFLDFVLTDDFQSVIPITNWMFPVVPETELPDGFEIAVVPEKSLILDYAEIQANYDRWIDMWLEAVVE